MSTPTLRWLQIHQYEQFEPVRIEFSPKENLILGLNGAGKTQLLKLIWAVLTLNFRELRDQELHVEFELVTDASRSRSAVTIVARVRTKPESGPTGEADAERSFPRASSGLEVSMSIRSGGRSFQFKLAGSVVSLLDEHGKTLATSRAEAGVSLVPQNYIWNWDPVARDRIDEFSEMHPLRGSCYFGEAAAEFQVFVSEFEFELRYRTDRAQPLVRIHTAKLEATNSRLLWDLDRAAFKIASAYERGTLNEGIVPEQIGIDSQSLCAPIGAAELRLRPEVVRESEQTVDCRGIRTWLRFRNGTEVRDSELTFGQKRYLYAALVSRLLPGLPVVCDEIDNGMHPRLVLALLEMWSDRQVFVASHNRLVIDSTNFYGPADVREKIHIVRRDDAGRQTVGVFDEATADEIFAKIDVGLMSPGEVLLAEGLW